MEKRFCRVCNNIFELNVYRYGKNWLKKNNRGIFCSRNCFYIYRKGMRVSPNTEFKSENMIWDKHPNFKTGIWSYQRFRKGECEKCKIKENLQIHHKDKNRYNNNLNNLITLCRSCHWSNHKGRITWNKGLRTGSLSKEHREKISISMKKFYE